MLNRMSSKRAIGALLCVLASVAASAQDCNRDCLKRHLDAYLTASRGMSPGREICGSDFAKPRIPW